MAFRTEKVAAGTVDGSIGSTINGSGSGFGKSYDSGEKRRNAGCSLIPWIVILSDGSTVSIREMRF